MGVDHGVKLVVGVDAEEARDAKGQSLVDRYQAGEFGPPVDAPEEVPFAFEEAWSEAAPAELDLFPAGSAYGEGPFRIVVGVELLHLDRRVESIVAGPLDPADVAKAARRVEEELRKLGVRAAPTTWLVWYEQ